MIYGTTAAGNSIKSIMINSINCYDWNGYRLSEGDISCVVAPDIGGRIVSLTHRGEELLFVSDEHRGEVFDFSLVRNLKQRKQKLGFRLWGGDKTWVAPQSEWWEDIPPLELDAGRYSAELGENRVTLKSPVCRETGLSITRVVEMDSGGEIRLREIFQNETDSPIRRGIWNVTQLLRPFDVYLPLTREALRPYAHEGISEQVYLTLEKEQDGWLKIPCRSHSQFKFGCLATRGVILAMRESGGETLTHLRTFTPDPVGEYAHNSSVEIFNSLPHDYLEVEVHAPLITLAPGEQTMQEQTWRFARIPGNPGPSLALEYMTDLANQT